MSCVLAPPAISAVPQMTSAPSSDIVVADDVASALASAASTLISPMVMNEMVAGKDMVKTSRILNDYINMVRVQLMSDTHNSSFGLETPNPKMMFTPLDLPTTAELMQRCLAVNPFEAKFREANQKINSGSMQPNTSAANQSLEALEANGGLGQFCGTGPGSMTDLLLKIPQSTLQQSPGIFSNIHLLAAAGEGSEVLTRENLKTADISKLLSVAGDISAQAPRTADVLNAVLDMHSDRLHTINYLNNKPDFSALLRSPSSSAPNSASILANAMTMPSTSGANLLAPPKTVSAYHSPLGAQSQPPSTQKSPSISSIQSSSQNSSHLDVSWGSDRADKPIKKEMPYFGDEAMMLMERNNMSSSGSEQDQAAGPSGNSSTSTGNPVGRPQNGTPGRGRGRGRSTTADMQPDERRNTILERNKAAAVRYRKRKKEEHDDMMGRVQAMEQEKNQLLAIQTQNQVLRRELERLTALLTERESRCVCLKGLPMSEEQHADLIAARNNGNGMYGGSDMINGLGQINGMHMKLPKMG